MGILVGLFDPRPVGNPLLGAILVMTIGALAVNSALDKRDRRVLLGVTTHSVVDR